MAGTKGVFRSLMVEKYSSSKSFLCRSRNNLIQQQNIFSLHTNVFYSRKKKAIVVSPVTALAEAELVKAAREAPVELKLTALVTVRNERKGSMKEMIFKWLGSDNSSDQKGVVLQLVSTEIDARTKETKLSKEAIIDWSGNLDISSENVTHKVEFVVDADFGMPGAVVLTNRYQNELYLEGIAIEGVVNMACNSWVQPEKLHAEKRIFFSNKAYLPSDTPEGLKALREEELKQIRGTGEGIRKPSDRFYDYDVYNDLGNPDKGIEYARPIIGDENHPHPRRCRTGRPPSNTDVNIESPVNESIPMYVPRDEALEEQKRETISAGKLKGMLNNLLPSLKDVSDDNDVIKGFSEINDLYKESPSSNEIKIQNELWKKPGFPLILSELKQSTEEIFKFDPPNIISRDASFCLRDDEFGRLTLAGLNPVTIERLKVFPPVSKLDPHIYKTQDSALREEHIECHLNGMSVQQALEENKLFILDYHDIYFPFLNRINAVDSRKAYSTRTIFFLTQMGTLKPIAIELCLPTPKPNQVLTPPVDATSNWLWQLGKAHVCSNDSGAHQLIHHWLRTHACMEPFIIATHRQLSVMHPVYKLLHPHMRYTLEINAQARKLLLNAGGILESNFSVGECAMEICSSAYASWWRFDMEGLPADLLRRGIAIPDTNQAHGLRLLIEDYPYANDGLLIWSAIETMVKTYISFYYPEASIVQSDKELNAWYKESIDVGHADLRHSSWWPELSTPNDLVSILTTIIWVESAQHAALNFGQYHYGGYIPIRPPLMRRTVPNLDNCEYTEFLDDPQAYNCEYTEFLDAPQAYFLSSLPSLRQVTHFMSVLEILSTHSPDEEYLAERKDLSSWSQEPEIIEAFYRFSMEMRRIEKEIGKRNGDPKLRNRCGAGVSPYELLVPSSGPGVTFRGVPNSVTI